MAVWSKDGNEYDATVIKKHNNGKCQSYDHF